MTTHRLGISWHERNERVGNSCDENDLLAVSQSRGVVRRSDIESGPPRALDLSEYKICAVGDIVLNRFNAYRGSLGLSRYSGVVSPDYAVMRPNQGFVGRYLEYVLRSNISRFEMTKSMGGIGGNDPDKSGFARIDLRALNRMRVPVRSDVEQQAIANYLDRETQRIDELIAEQRGLIETLRERRQASIDVRTNGTGALTPLRRVVTHIRQGWSPSADSVPADGIDEWGVLKVGCSNTGTFRPQENKRLPTDVHPRPEHSVLMGEIVMSRSNTRLLVGSASLVQENYPRLMLSDLLYGVRIGEGAVAEYVTYALRSRAVRGQIVAAAKGMSASMQKLSQSDILNLEIELPSLSDQRARADAIRGDLSKVDELISESEDLIALSQERRAALITAAVTGQIDVRAAA